jgi:uncharacterized repeat protein (TIGR01451 family)
MSPRLPHVARRTRLGVIAGAMLLVLLAAAASSASAASPWWRLSTRATPSNLPPGGKGLLTVTASNLGDESVNAEKSNVHISDTLPAGLEAIAVRASVGPKSGPSEKGQQNLSCDPLPALRCTFITQQGTFKSLLPFEQVTMEITVKVTAGGEAKLTNTARVDGGEAESNKGVKGGPVEGAVGAQPVTVSSAPTPFGVEKLSLAAENEGGSTDIQAGSHPFQLTTTLAFNSVPATNPVNGEEYPGSPALARNLHVNLPAGLLGNPTAMPQCPEIDFFSQGLQVNFCEGNTAIGVARVTIYDPNFFNLDTVVAPVFNLVPKPGEPARFGFDPIGVPIILDTAIDTGGDYHAIVNIENSPQTVTIVSSEVTIWGVPGEAVHDQSRGWECVEGGTHASAFGKPCTALADQNPHAFLTLPTSCSGRQEATVSGDSWPTAQKPEGFTLVPPSAPSLMEALAGCDALPFNPSFTVEPEVPAANTPTAVTVHVHVPQDTTLQPNGLGESAVKSTTVTFPEGVLLSPSAANGLQACPEEGIGFLGPKEFEPGVVTNSFTPSLPAVLCPSASKVGIVHIKSPDLVDEIEGGVYIAAQNANPFGSLFAMYILAEAKKAGVLVKLAGEVHLNPQTGQISSTFANTPAVPFEDLKLELLGGPRASLTTPPTCGGYETKAAFTPWSGSPAAPGTLPASATFNITSGQGGSGCSSPPPFAPSLQAGTTNKQAAAYTPFAVTIAHPDSDQALTGVSMTLPPGVAGILASVSLCPEPQASQGTCGPESLIGHATASAGLGPEPFTQSGGQVFITGPYHGAPFGLSIVVPAAAGPFDFGNVVTRSTIKIDPSTAALTINSPLPTMVNTAQYETGVPVQLKQIHVTVDRPNFQFNPTNCNPMAITGTLSGAQGGSEALSYPFQVTNCASLPFAPKLTASSQAQASKNNGASLSVNVESAGLGQANIGKVELQLPAALPSRLTTIQKACRDTVFEVNPAGCEEGSVIGRATIHTPVLKNPLTGPAYLVSHGNAAFPDVEFVLQGEGITVVLDGKTDIKKGITYSRFEAAPDAPFTKFETELPTGPHSALGANLPVSSNYNLCGSKLVIPTKITGQNGAVIKQSTNIAVSGCHGVKGFKATRAQLLAKALKACRKLKKKSKRVACEKQARKRYGLVSKGHKASHRHPAKARRK